MKIEDSNLDQDEARSSILYPLSSTQDGGRWSVVGGRWSVVGGALLLAFMFLLAACDTAGTRQAIVSSAPTAPPTQAPTAPLPASPTRGSLPSAAPSPIATPAPTVTAIPAATATPRPTPPLPPPQPTQAPQLAQPAHHIFPVRSDGKISYGQFHHDYPATDIFCPIGSEFLAVTDGVVDYVSRQDVWDPAVNDGATRGGLSVAIIGDDGVRYYGSHLSQVADGIEPGVRVTAGQLLGLTGKTGDARNTDAHLHFGISHPTRPDDWAVRRGEIPPYAYLGAWQRGEDVTPKLP